ncbi:MAG: helix-turn-helix transcriptional regulator [Firmicutes bacterium]|nr:helix-turn-helix transcriptional regulator [Bacillota bacterium]
MISSDYIISKRMVDIRIDMDLTQEEMANKLNVRQATYSRWETATQIIPLVKLNEFCNLTGYSMDYVMGLCPKDEMVKYKRTILSKEKIGQNLMIFRLNHNLFQYQLANFLNTTQSTISAYENGKTMILTAFAYQIAKEYQISMDEFCGRQVVESSFKNIVKI